MPQKALRVACIQLNSGNDWEKNWKQAQKYIVQASRRGAKIAALPENFVLRASEAESRQIAPIVFNEVLRRLKETARQCHVTLVAGSLLEPAPSKKNKFFNTCFVISNQGKILLRYRKIHLFDVCLPKVKVQESRMMTPGKLPGFFTAEGIKAGVGICYDLRFPEYFRVLSQKGVEVLYVPANFTAETGKTAWKVLLRARAIENQCFVVAPGQCGRHSGSGVLSYGHSLIIDPLGRIVKEASLGAPGVLVSNLEMGGLREYRRVFPVLKHRKVSI